MTTGKVSSSYNFHPYYGHMHKQLSHNNDANLHQHNIIVIVRHSGVSCFSGPSTSIYSLISLVILSPSTTHQKVQKATMSSLPKSPSLSSSSSTAEPSSSNTSSTTSCYVLFSYQGKSFYTTVTTATNNGADLHQLAREVLQEQLLLTLNPASTTTTTSDSSNDGNDDKVIELKLLYKGKRIMNEYGPPILEQKYGNTNNNKLPGTTTATKTTATSNTPKIMVMASTNTAIRDVQTRRSDPTIRGLDQEIAIERQKQVLKNQRAGSGPHSHHHQQQQVHWGEGMVQSKQYKFCRFEACTWQSFGHRPTDHHTPHAFQAMSLLEKLATDPGIVAIMNERELVVGTLGEMDPIDDRLMLEKQHGGSCLLGYNTNAGARIDIKLRTDDLKGFRSYYDLVATLIHELSHNWVGDHNLLFWTNYAQMRAEYLYRHSILRSTIVLGKTTAELAGLDKARLDDVYSCIMQELIPEMAQHGLHPRMIEGPIQQRINELEETHRRGHRLGGGGGESETNTNHNASRSSRQNNGNDNARELALAAAERRAREQQRRKEEDNKKR
jgi:hypothetical protein